MLDKQIFFTFGSKLFFLIPSNIKQIHKSLHMESAKEWCRLLSDCFAGKVDLIITQKVSNVSKKHYEITILTRMLAALEKPVGIYFVSENIFTLASYYQHDNHDREFFPSGDWEVLPEDEAEELPLLMGGVEDA